MKKTKQNAIAEVTHNLMVAAGEKMESVKDSLVAGKDKVVAIVEEKMEAAKKVIHDHTAPKSKTVKNTVKKKATVVKKAAVKAVKKAVKKAAKKLPAKKSRKR